MKLEKIQSWIAPEGFHQAKIADARLTKKYGSSNKDEDELRLIFLITSLVHPIKQMISQVDLKISLAMKKAMLI